MKAKINEILDLFENKVKVCENLDDLEKFLSNRADACRVDYREFESASASPEYAGEQNATCKDILCRGLNRGKIRERRLLSSEKFL